MVLTDTQMQEKSDKRHFCSCLSSFFRSFGHVFFKNIAALKAKEDIQRTNVYTININRTVATMKRTEALASVKILSLFFLIFVPFFTLKIFFPKRTLDIQRLSTKTLPRFRGL